MVCINSSSITDEGHMWTVKAELVLQNSRQLATLGQNLSSMRFKKQKEFKSMHMSGAFTLIIKPSNHTFT